MPEQTTTSVGSKRLNVIALTMAALSSASDFKFGVLITIVGVVSVLGVTLTDWQKQAKNP